MCLHGPASTLVVQVFSFSCSWYGVRMLLTWLVILVTGPLNAGVARGVAQIRAQLPAGVDGWGYSLKGMMGMVVVGGLLITATYFGMQRKVVPKVQALQKVRPPPSAERVAACGSRPAQVQRARAASCVMGMDALAFGVGFKQRQFHFHMATDTSV